MNGDNVYPHIMENHICELIDKDVDVNESVDMDILDADVWSRVQFSSGSTWSVAFQECESAQKSHAHSSFRSAAVRVLHITNYCAQVLHSRFSLILLHFFPIWFVALERCWHSITHCWHLDEHCSINLHLNDLLLINWSVSFFIITFGFSIQNVKLQNLYPGNSSFQYTCHIGQRCITSKF